LELGFPGDAPGSNVFGRGVGEFAANLTRNITPRLFGARFGGKVGFVALGAAQEVAEISRERKLPFLREGREPNNTELERIAGIFKDPKAVARISVIGGLDFIGISAAVKIRSIVSNALKNTGVGGTVTRDTFKSVITKEFESLIASHPVLAEVALNSPVAFADGLGSHAATLVEQGIGPDDPRFAKLVFPTPLVAPEITNLGIFNSHQ